MVIGIDVSRAVSGQRTGTEAYAFYLTEALIPLACRRGHRLRLYFNHPPPSDHFLEGPNVEQIVIPWPRMWTHLRLASELHRRPPELFFTPAHVIPISYRGTSVATVHDLGYHYFPEAHTRGQVAYLRWSTRHNARRSRTVIADSETTKDDLIRLYHIDAAKITAIYPGTDPSLRRINDSDYLHSVLRKYGITPPYVLYIGTLQPRKNLRRLVQAFAGSGIPHQLVVAGKAGWLANPILATVFDYQSPITNNIVLPGYVDDKDKAALISQADALLYPSLYEGFGFPVLEGNACGTPVLCSNTSSLPEIAGKAALLVNPTDVAAMSAAIARIVTDASLREELVREGYKNVERYTWQNTAQGVIDILEAAAN